MSRVARLLGRANVESGTARIEPVRAFAHHVGPRESVFAEARAVALRRGPIRLGSVRVQSSFPFGLIRKSVTFTQPAEALIHPKATHVERVPMSASGGFGSDVRSARAGDGDEFHSLREFREGDALRTIAWRASARRNTPMVKQFVASSPARLLIELELARAADRSGDDERSISAAAGLALAASRSGIAVAVQERGGGVIVPMGVGTGQAGRVLDELALLDLSRPRAGTAGFIDGAPGLTRLVIRDGQTAAPASARPGDGA